MSGSDQPSPSRQGRIGDAPFQALGVAEAVAERLWSHAYQALRGISCEYREGVLVLRGRLESYYLKQLAQEVAGGVEGVVRLTNQIEVVGRG
jgi:osmotically-inducible protein OsmY